MPASQHNPLKHASKNPSDPVFPLFQPKCSYAGRRLELSGSSAVSEANRGGSVFGFAAECKATWQFPKNRGSSQNDLAPMQRTTLQRVWPCNLIRL